MRISASNIAWDVSEDDEIARVLREQGVDSIDVAPGKYFGDLDAATGASIDRVRTTWAARGFRIHGMQALLFGTQGLNLFSDSREAMLKRLGSVCRIGGGLGAQALTFGSPRQRDRQGLDDETVSHIAVDFFRRLGDLAGAAGVTVCLEPNPAVYGCNFMTHTDQAADMVAMVAHPAIRLQLDVGAMTLNEEPVRATILRHAKLIGHVHASEPQLVTLGDGGAPHHEAADALREARPDLTVTIEMVASQSKPHVEEMARAARMAANVYGDRR